MQLRDDLDNLCDHCGDRLVRDENEVTVMTGAGSFVYHGECWDSASGDHPEWIVRAIQAAKEEG